MTGWLSIVISLGVLGLMWTAVRRLDELKHIVMNLTSEAFPAHSPEEVGAAREAAEKWTLLSSKAEEEFRGHKDARANSVELECRLRWEMEHADLARKNAIEKRDFVLCANAQVRSGRKTLRAVPLERWQLDDRHLGLTMRLHEQKKAYEALQRNGHITFEDLEWGYPLKLECSSCRGRTERTAGALWDRDEVPCESCGGALSLSDPVYVRIYGVEHVLAAVPSAV